MPKKKIDKDIEQPIEDKPTIKRFKQEEVVEPVSIIITKKVPLPIKPMPIVVPDPKVITDVFTKYGGWVFKNGKVFMKEAEFLTTDEGKGLPFLLTVNPGMAHAKRHIKKAIRERR
jgi:hypothetical protein